MELVGERVVLRELTLEDWPAVHEWASRPEACRFQTWGPNTPEETRAHVERIVAATAAQPRAEYSLLAVLRDGGKAVGSGSLFVRNRQFGVGEVAYIVHPDFWGQGLASEIAGLLVGWGFAELGLHRIYGTCDPRNVGSARVLQKLGMVHEGRMRETMLIRDGWRDSDMYAVLEHEWTGAPPGKITLPGRTALEIGIAGWALNRSIRQDKTLTLLKFPALARGEFGVDVVELVSTFFESQSANYLNDLRRALEAEKLTVHNIAVDTGSLCSPDEATRRTDLETIAQWFHVARALGSAAIRVNTGHAEVGDAAALDRIVEGYRELAEHGARSGVKLLIENHGGVSADPANIETILERVDTEWFATCPDVNNFVGDTWEEGTRIMAPRAFAVHVKTTGYDPEGWQTKQARDGSTGRFNLKRQLQILKEAGYQGPLNYEYNLAEHDERVGIAKGIAYTRELLASI